MNSTCRFIDGYNGDTREFFTIEAMKEAAEQYTIECDGDWIPIYYFKNSSTGKWEKMSIQFIRKLSLPY